MATLIGTSVSEKFTRTGTYQWDGTAWVLVSSTDHTTKGDDLVRAGGGDDVVIAGAGDDLIRGNAGNDLIRGGLGADTMFGGSGIDTLSYGGSKAGVNVNLRTGAADGGDATGDVFSGFENIQGSKFNDTLFGNGKANVINGRAGDDAIKGAAGADILRGGKGVDTLIYQGSKAGVAINLANNTASGGHANGDVISGFENVVGSRFDDVLIGSDGDNKLLGKAGNDVIRGGAGADILRGGAGFDTLSYVGSSAAVTVDLSTKSASGGDATGDIIGGFENLTGSAFDDTLTGNSGNNIIRGGAGGDTMDGGNGFDTVSYLASNAAVTVDLSTNTVSGGHANGDVISNFENIIGSAHDDTLTGDGGNNVIEGGAGGDTMDGGGGFDTLSYEGADTGVTVDLSTNTVSGGDANGDIISNFENIIGSDYADILTGDGAGNVIRGGGGADTMTGNGGDDVFKFNKVSDQGDIIADFTGGGVGGGDKIDLSKIDAVAGAGNDAFVFGGTTATANGVWYSVSGGNVTVYADTDGDASTVEFTITLNGVGSLIDSDFIL